MLPKTLIRHLESSTIHQASRTHCQVSLKFAAGSHDVSPMKCVTRLSRTEKWQSPYPDSRLDEDNDVKDWLREDVVEDSGCSIDALDIRQALDTKFCWARDPHGRPKLTIFNVAYLCSEVFPTARFMEIGHGTAVLITNLRWRKLAGGHICTTIGADAFGTHMIDLRKESCEILHLPQPERTFAWLRLCFKEASMRGVPRTSLWNLYERAFWRSRDTHEYLDKEAFFDCARKAFKGCHEVEVSTNHFVSPLQHNTGLLHALRNWD